MQNKDFWCRIASLYWSQPSSEDFAGKTATFGSDLQVYMGPSHHLWFCACTTETLGPEIPVSMGPRPHLLFFAFKTATLAPE